MVVGDDGQVRYTGALYDAFHRVSPAIAQGFNVRDLDAVFGEMEELRARLLATG